MKDSENKMIMARNIQRYMDQRGISRQQLCDDLDIKYTTLRDWIKGVTYPRIGKVEAMAQYFGCEKSDLIEDKKEKPTAQGDELPEKPDGCKSVFYDRYAQICEKHGISMSAAALEAGLSKSLVTKWKVNEVDVPSPDVLKKLSTYFGIPVSELLGEDKTEEKPAAQGDGLSEKMSNKSIFAKNLQYQMDINRKDRRDVCEALGVSYYTFSDWINGKKYPRMDKVEMLANYFGISKSDLIEDKEEKPTAQGNRLSEEMQELINCIKTLPDDNILTLLQIARMMELINCTKALPEDEILKLLRAVRSIR